ncbi:MAG TPA: terminase family protein [Amaricoccus sp.]|nr:terminase family protein [uncultured Amaricoccus sp.]HRO11722.1 terminase family protein [Amaricoccus sp.]
MSGLPQGELDAFLEALSPNALMSLPWLFEQWALGHQLPPEGDWATWVILGGRGAGKTRAGAEWVRAQVEGAKPGDPGACSRVALVGETLDQAREVMVFGSSGLLAASPPDRRPEWQASRRRLVWPNGAVAETYSARDPESLRGPQFDAAWCDEVGKWSRAEEAWDQLQFALRLGARPRAVVTTTPRRNPMLLKLIEAADTVVTRAPTEANRMHLAPGFVERLAARHAGTRLGRQELEGEFVLDIEGALWTWETIEAARRPVAGEPDRIVVAVDPPVTSGEGADECGIVVAGVVRDGPLNAWVGEVIADASLRGASPQRWAERAVALYHAHRADRLVAEVNQGGQMIETLVRQIDPMVSFRAVVATRGKGLRAEPVAALYEQGRIRHARVFPELEAQMAAMTVGGYAGRGSPDRLDALVWAITELMLDPEARLVPGIRTLGR